MRIAFGTDERTALTDHIKAALAERGHDVVVVGEGDPWPDVGRGVGEAVAGGDAATAAGARRWNDANVLALGLRLTSASVADEMIEQFLATAVEDDERPNIGNLD